MLDRRTFFRSAVKLIGIGIFVAILSHIDRQALLLSLKQMRASPAAASFLILMLSYGFKTVRWHMLVQAAGLRPSFRDSWRLFHIGIFLGNISPGNIGELGRAAYLKQQGIPVATGVTIGLADRLADMFVMGFIGLVSFGILFGKIGWYATCIGTLVLIISGFFFLMARKNQGNPDAQSFIQRSLQPNVLVPVLLITLCSWFLYFVWTILLARSLGIEISSLILAAALTITGIVTLLPISPAGLGTREAALLALLAPYGVEPSQTVALALMMFVFIIASSLLGGLYWLKGEIR